MVKRVFVVLWSLVLFAAPLFAFQPPAGQTEFVPISELPPADQLPAAPLLITAYAFVWLALMSYLWSIWRRLGNVEADMQKIEKRSAHRSHGQ